MEFNAALMCPLCFPLIFSFSCPAFLNSLPFLFPPYFLSFCAIVTLCFSFPSFLLRFFFLGLFFLRYGFFPLTFILCSELYCQKITCIFLLLFWDWSFPLFFLLLGSMVDSFEVRRLYPSLSFFFARLGAFLGSSRSFGSSI